MPRLQQRWSAPLVRSSRLLDNVCNTALFAVLLAAFYQYYSYGQYDPYGCRALLNDGSWPPADSNSHLYREFERWEPSGCRMREFSRDDFRDCLTGRRVVFAGDSTVRQVYWAAAARLDHVKAGLAVLDVFSTGAKQQDLSLEAEGVKLEFIWDPWLNSTKLATELTRFRAQETLIDVGTLKSQDEESAGLIVVSAPGLWAARHGGEDYFTLFQRGIDDIIPHLRSNLDGTMTVPTANLKKNYETAPNQILLAPVQVPLYDALSPGRAETITPEKVNKMNSYLASLSSDETSHIMWSYNKMTQNHWKAFEETGIHVTDSVAERKIDIALNARCNAAAVGHKIPMARTCCMAYPRESRVQPALLLMGVVVLPVLLWCNSHIKSIRQLMPSNDVLRATRTILFAMVWCWFMDRTQYFVKVERHYYQGFFVAGCLVFGLISLLFRRSANMRNITTSSPIRARSVSEPLRQDDSGFLSREQSNEWKGWMQFLILFYHYNYASQTLWAYKIIRLLVSAYIFLNAYGHTRHLLETGDFSFRRLAAVIFRSNALSAILPYMMTTDHMFYYFASVVTFWYLFVWLTLRVLSRWNQDPLLLLAKVLISAVLTSCFVMIHGPLEGLSTLCRVIFHMPWDSREARVRLSLERYIVFFGIMTASIVHRIALVQTRQVLPSSSLTGSTRTHGSSRLDPALAIIAFPDALTRPIKPIVCTFSVLFIIFFTVMAQMAIGDKVQYNLAHPYMSWIPIVAFALLRNSYRSLRNTYLALPAALGKISLETYILQYHMWLGGDATAILRIGLFDRYGSPLRGLGLAGLGRMLETLLIAAVFLCVSAQTHRATETLTHWLFGTGIVQGHERTTSVTMGSPLAQTKERTSEDGYERPLINPGSVDDANGVLWVGGREEPGILQRPKPVVARDPRLQIVGLAFVLWIGNLVYGG
ncbi:10 TM acyl transferase domain found in Cas1p-domain-containing protein [Pseudomassariella vexata]|uniref:10 TM acyl transferase domain found in Cas1p-domain-containing protein n=1 Tax=Pseudomassariella vexata TaxID=1141098 RepID=A0A1Y2ED61_9PEZI|nr:10 TM acyl transferase domain found in Cas1p-domain-containing protein [Pseudomassariella vexata]ORY69511.1 10 TM acyl transferase domain found in Cas1p-domain-containing protein [Pseudomassariella vexata]